jgi:hypothetical protein
VTLGSQVDFRASRAHWQFGSLMAAAHARPAPRDFSAKHPPDGPRAHHFSNSVQELEA